MYILWARGHNSLEFEKNRFEIPKVDSHNSGLNMIQLLRADKIQIPEK